jgi:ribosomal protein S26
MATMAVMQPYLQLSVDAIKSLIDTVWYMFRQLTIGYTLYLYLSIYIRIIICTIYKKRSYCNTCDISEYFVKVFHSHQRLGSLASASC